jgi:hypothetical protein
LDPNHDNIPRGGGDSVKESWVGAKTFTT